MLARKWMSALPAAGAPQLPLWDTENNFGLAGPGPTNPDQDITGERAASWTARTYLDALRLGISRVYWYSWGPELDLVGIQMNATSPAALAYKTLQDWIVGATYNGCKGATKVTCTFTKSGVKTQVIWGERGSAVFKVKPAFKQICTLAGKCTAVSGKRIRITGPVLLKP